MFVDADSSFLLPGVYGVAIVDGQHHDEIEQVSNSYVFCWFRVEISN